VVKDLKCKLGGTLQSGLGPDNGCMPFRSNITIWGGERFEP